MEVGSGFQVREILVREKGLWVGVCVEYEPGRGLGLGVDQ
jgi:hypothetical protein